MGQPNDIIIRNFYRMLRSGALNEFVDIEPMSPHKWRKLANVMIAEGVADMALRAVKNQQYEPSFNMPADLAELLRNEATKQRRQNTTPEMNNTILNKKLSNIFLAEKNSGSYSKESLDAFSLIIINCQHILNNGASTRFIIRLGNYIRTNAKKIDYDKVNRWLRELQMHRVACLVGSILITNFAFKKEDVPFVKKVDAKAAKTMTSNLMRHPSAWQNRTLDYFGYAPLENASIFLKGLKNRLDSIEE